MREALLHRLQSVNDVRLRCAGILQRFQAGFQERQELRDQLAAERLGDQLVVP